MIQRIVSALIALPVALTLIHLGGWWFSGLIMFATAVCSYEFAMMAGPDDRLTGMLAALLGAFGIYGISIGAGTRPEMLAVVAFVVMLFILWFLFRPGAIESAGYRLGVTLAGIFWSTLLMSGLLYLRFLPESGLAWLYLACALAWGSDTGAYFAGKYLGKKKLYPAVSPKKTWAGAIGGVISATGIAFAVQYSFSGPSIPATHLFGLGIIGSALGQMGDLSESLIKRSMGVKDSGKIMPGHGGLLDRVDALFFTGTWLFTYATFFVGDKPIWL